MYDFTYRQHALRLLRSGLSITEVSRQLGVNRSTVRDWRDHEDRDSPMTGVCPRCCLSPSLPSPGHTYTYLLGLYLGDGCISRVGDPRKDVWSLRIACADAWPGIRAECVAAMQAIRPTNKVRVLQRQGYSEVNSFSKHWPHLFPQHGPHKKHERKIVLEPWQRSLVKAHPGALVRGLMHSDGYRGMNRIRHRVNGEDRWYEYPRYLFKNESADILQLCGEALDMLGVAWRYSRHNTISIAKRSAVEALDAHVGPKY
ncbi:helix-turn-helix domain-containing protein [Thermoactinospora rubra]|uniref:helix-turn-helix domain-containing protein n=1 Tax=Thermoactinospora rubra TaxID=1088767 RepID=UPI001F0A52CE|nr:helix-turn-helix domain-containing protein [Thermoactinospora rubra]